MSKQRKKKKPQQAHLPKIVLATVLIELIEAVIRLIETIINKLLE